MKLFLFQTLFLLVIPVYQLSSLIFFMLGAFSAALALAAIIIFRKRAESDDMDPEPDVIW